MVPFQNYKLSQIIHSMIKQVGVLEDNILERNNNNYEALAIKCLHLTQQNAKLHQSIQDLQTQLCSLRTINQQLVNNSPKTVQIILEELTRQNANLEKSLFKVIKNNEQLSSDVLMKSQLITENQNEFREMVASYENKIFELRSNLQAKQAYMTNIEQKKMTEKGESFNFPSRSNLMYFNELSELRSLRERYHIQNTSLQLLVTAKDEQNQQLKIKLHLCQKSLKNGQNWSSYHNKLQNTTQLQKTKQKSSFKLRLEQQLTRYDNKYKQFTLHQSKTTNASSQISNLKLLISELYNCIQSLQEQKVKLQRTINNKEADLHQIKIAYRQLEIEMKQQLIEVDFYRHNFLELTKVTTQQKIKYYNQNYHEELPLIKQNFNNLTQMVAYWKEEQKSNTNQNGAIANQRRMLSRYVKKSKLKTQKRSLSCVTKYNPFAESSKKVCTDLKMQNSIISFINQTHNVPSALGYTVTQREQVVKKKEEQNILFGEISVIEKPTRAVSNKPDRKQLFLEEEL